MAEADGLSQLLDSWFKEGDEQALRRAFSQLGRSLHAPQAVVAGLGAAAVDEVRQDVLARLLDPKAGALRGATEPTAYARAAFRNELATHLKKWERREARTPEVKQFIENTGDRDNLASVEARLDATRAVALAQELPAKQRLAVLLTTRPDRISAADWDSVVSKLPPPPPSRPSVPLDRDDASRLLYPPQGPESAKQRYARLNNFDHAYTRALEQLRQRLEEE